MGRDAPRLSRYYMASPAAMHGPLSSAATQLRESLRNNARPVLWAGFLTLLVAGPWLLYGYVFGTDWPGPWRFYLLTTVSSAAPLSAGLAALGFLVGGEAAGKIFIFSVF